jgi:hypothetical protein
VAQSNAASFFSPEIQSDSLRRGSALRDAVNVWLGQHSGQPDGALQQAAEA